MEVYIPSIFIFSVILADYFVFSVLQTTIYRSLRDNYKWLRRESELLNALVGDYQRVKESVKEINRKVLEMMPGAAGISMQLDDGQRAWLATARGVAMDAKELVGWHERWSSQGYFHKWRGLALISLIPTYQHARAMTLARKEMVDHLADDTISLRKICEWVELSSEKVRCLKERPIDETGAGQTSGPGLPSHRHDLIDQEPRLVQMKLHQDFMEDLQGLRLESEMEKAWVAEAGQMVGEIEKATREFFMEKEEQQGRWLSIWGKWRARRRVKAKIELVDSLLSDLLEAKERYGFKFVGRESSKILEPTLRGDDRTGVSTKTGEIRVMLGRERPTMSTVVFNEVTALCNQLEQAEDLLNKTEASNEGAHKTRTACLKQLTTISSKAVFILTNFIETGPYPRMPFALPYISPFRSEISDLQKAARFIRKSIRGHRVKMVKDSSSVVGFEADIHTLVSKLKSATEPPIVCIVGMMGIGKTTLAKEICNHTSRANHFKVCRLFPVPQQDNGVPQLVEKVKLCLETWESGRESEGKPSLLVLDNLSSEVAWGELKQLVTTAATSGKIRVVITTRDKKVASCVQPSTIHHLQLRTNEESWEFFTQMVPMSRTIVQTQLPSEEEEETPRKKKEALLKKIVRRAGGLPLTILHIGHLLAGKGLEDVTLDELSRVLEHVSQGHNQKPWLDMWEINKADMWEINEADIKSPSILGKCLSSFEIIPFNFDIPARRVTALWVARGLVDRESSESAAHEHLLELINRNMIQVVERRLNGKVKTCWFPFALRELWLQRPLDSGAIRAWSLTTSQDGQLAYHFDDTDTNHNNRIQGLGAALQNYIHRVRFPRVIMFFDTREGKKPGHDIGSFLQKGIRSGELNGLLVLDLEGTFRPHLQKYIGELKKLTYLGLRWTYLERIPSSVGELPDLRTLDMKYTCIRTLPVSVWKLKKLRHLYLNDQCRITEMPKPSAMQLGGFQILSGAFLDEDSPLKDNLGMLTNLRKLDLVFQLTIPQQQKLAKLILTLTKLRSLSLSSVDVKSKPQDLILEDLSGLDNLSVLYLFGKLETTFQIKDKLPNSLTEIILSATGLQADPMGVLGELPKLKSLSFFSDSYRGANMACSSESFPQLLDLKLWSLSSLISLNVDEKAMPNLREMEIRSCNMFEKSEGLTHLKTLQELKLTYMPPRYVQDVKSEFAPAINHTHQKIHYPKIKIEDLPSEVIPSV